MPLVNLNFALSRWSAVVKMDSGTFRLCSIVKVISFDAEKGRCHDCLYRYHDRTYWLWQWWRHYFSFLPLATLYFSHMKTYDKIPFLEISGGMLTDPELNLSLILVADLLMALTFRMLVHVGTYFKENLHQLTLHRRCRFTSYFYSKNLIWNDFTFIQERYLILTVHASREVAIFQFSYICHSQQVILRLLKILRY